MPLPPVPDRYTVRGLLGQGGMGAVWKVHDKRLRRDLAMKVIFSKGVSGDALTRMAQEAQVTGQLEHPSIVPVHDLGRLADGSVYYTMKLIRGRLLSDVLAERWQALRAGTVRYPAVMVELVGVLARVCEAIAFAHDRGVVHRDLKPDNIMVGEFGEVQVMDWGLARLIDAPQVPEHAPAVVSDRALNNPQRTLVGRIAGTPSYMAPEQARGDLDVGPAADVWALGCMLYEVLCGVRAFDGPVDDVLADVMQGRFLPPSERTRLPVSRDLAAVARHAMQVEPQDRHPSAQTLAADLNAWLHGELLDTVPYSPVERALHAVRRHRLVLSGIALTSTVALLVLGWWTWRSTSDLHEALTQARDQADQARVDADAARIAQIEAQVDRARALQAQADALVVAGELTEARRLYLQARDALSELGKRTVGAELGLWGATHRAMVRAGELPLGTLPDVDAAGLSHLDVGPDGRLVGTIEQTVHVWPAAGGEGSQHDLEQVQDVRAVRLDARGNRLAVLGARGVEVVDLQSGGRGWLPVDGVRSVAWVGQERLALGMSDGSVWVRSLDGQPVWRSPAGTAPTTDLRLDGQGRLVVAAPERVRLLHAASGQERHRLPVGSGPATLDLRGERIVVAQPGGVRVLAIGEPSMTFDVEHTGAVTSAALSPDGEVLATTDDAGAVRLFDLADQGRLLVQDTAQAGIPRRVWWLDARRLLTWTSASVVLRDLDAVGGE